MASPKEGATKTQNGQKYVYKNGQWRPARFRTPANDLIEGTGNTARNATKKTAAATSTAASRTAERERQAQQRAIGLRGRNQKPAAKPAAKSAGAKPALSSEGIRDYAGTGADKRAVPTGSKTYNNWRNNQIATERERLKNVGNPPAKPAPKPSPKPAAKDTPKPAAPKPAGKVPSSTAGMKNQDKNFRGNPERKDSIASTLRELRGMGSGRKAAESKMSKPEDKSRYVAPNGKPYKGPAFGSGKAEPKKPASPASPNKSEKGMTLAERMRRRRMGMA